MKELTEQIGTLTESLLADMAKRNEGNKAAGARARKTTLALERLFKEYRKRSVSTSD